MSFDKMGIVLVQSAYGSQHQPMAQLRHVTRKKKQENNTSELPKLCLFLLQTILQSTSTPTLFILHLHLISVIPFVHSALKKTITSAQE